MHVFNLVFTTETHANNIGKMLMNDKTFVINSHSSIHTFDKDLFYRFPIFGVPSKEYNWLSDGNKGLSNLSICNAFISTTLVCGKKCISNMF